jgi:hypothetical protein
VEDFFEFLGFGAVVGITGHDFFHVGPPAFADGGVGDVVPAGFVFDFCVGEELSGFGVEEDGVVVDAVFFEDLLEFRPDGVVACFVKIFRSRG